MSFFLLGTVGAFAVELLRWRRWKRSRVPKHPQIEVVFSVGMMVIGGFTGFAFGMDSTARSHVFALLAGMSIELIVAIAGRVILDWFGGGFRDDDPTGTTTKQQALLFVAEPLSPAPNSWYVGQC